MGNPSERYVKLGLRDSFLKSHQYVVACKELSFILRNAYTKLPKATQSLVFQDILLAFSLFPQMRSQSAVSAANLLAQSADAELQKQKRVQAATEFKRAMIFHKRRFKAQVQGSVQLPQDVLMHIFSFLDVQSLVSASHVCWLWNSMANDNHLWQSQYHNFFGNSDKLTSAEGASHVFADTGETIPIFFIPTGIDWRKAFMDGCTGSSSKILSSSRGYCGHCRGLFWLSNTRCSNKHRSLTPENQQVKVVTNRQIVDYLLNGSWSTLSSFDSDSDSDDGTPGLKLWAYPRNI